MLEWHPTANNVLASAGHDNLVIVWNAARGEEMVRVDCHPDVVTSIRSQHQLFIYTCSPFYITINCVSNL